MPPFIISSSLTLATYIIGFKVIKLNDEISFNSSSSSSNFLAGIFFSKVSLILINKLYCETNLYILKFVLYNLGFSNYKLIYEEELYKDLHNPILSIWKDTGIYFKDNTSYYIDLKNKKDIKRIEDNTLLITSNKEIKNKLNKDLLIYENTYDPIFKMID